MKHIKLFEQFLINEDGYGRDFFFKKKDGKTFKYFFKIDDSEGRSLGFVLSIGKLSRTKTIDEAENSYGVISVEPMKESVMDDYLSRDSDYKSREDEDFNLERSEFLRFYKIVSESIKDYLQNSPKVSTLYDEILLNLDMDIKEYMETAEAMMDEWSYDKWGVQEGSGDRSLIYTRRDHE